MAKRNNNLNMVIIRLSVNYFILFLNTCSLPFLQASKSEVLNFSAKKILNNKK
jgi:hypothetical protein